MGTENAGNMRIWAVEDVHKGQSMMHTQIDIEGAESLPSGYRDSHLYLSLYALNKLTCLKFFF